MIVIYQKLDEINPKSYIPHFNFLKRVFFLLSIYANILNLKIKQNLIFSLIALLLQMRADTSNSCRKRKTTKSQINEY